MNRPHSVKFFGVWETSGAALDLVKAIKARIDPALYQRLVEALSKQAHLDQGS